MANKQQVIDLHRQYPSWTATDIAAAIGAYSAYVRATAKRCGLSLPKAKMGAPVHTPEQMRERAMDYQRKAIDLLARADAIEHAVGMK